MIAGWFVTSFVLSSCAPHGASHRYRPAETIHDWFF
jgi:hypothetical protein